MTPDEFRAALADLGATQRGFAEVWGLDERTVRRWALGERAVPSWVPVAFAMERELAALEAALAKSEAKLAKFRREASVGRAITDATKSGPGPTRR